MLGYTNDSPGRESSQPGLAIWSGGAGLAALARVLAGLAELALRHALTFSLV
jgi:hypothetical protein